MENDIDGESMGKRNTKKMRTTVADWRAKQAKRNASKKLTPKRAKFARVYVETGSKTQAYQEAFNVGPNTALATVHSEASRTASLPTVKSEIERLFDRNGLSLDDVVTVHKRNMTQDEHFPTSQRAVDSYYELNGMKKNATTPAINVAFVINRGVTQEGVEEPKQ